MTNTNLFSCSGMSSSVNLMASGILTEVFDDLVGTLDEPRLFWDALVNAVNNGQTTRGPSRLVSASKSTGVGHVIMTNAGADYTSGDLLAVLGGVFANPQDQAQIKVGITFNGSIVSYYVSRTGKYSVFPTSPAQVSGGTGTGAQFALTQGSGYVASIQNIVFSGGNDTSAASGIVMDSQAVSLPGAYLTALSIGSNGNNIKATITEGSNSTQLLPTFKLTISLEGEGPALPKTDFTLPPHGTGYLTAKLPTATDNIVEFKNVAGQIADSGTSLPVFLMHANLFAISVIFDGGSPTAVIDLPDLGILSTSMVFCNVGRDGFAGPVYASYCGVDQVMVVFAEDPGPCTLNLIICIETI